MHDASAPPRQSAPRGVVWAAPQPRQLLPFYGNFATRCTFTILRQIEVTFTLPPPYAMNEDVRGNHVRQRSDEKVPIFATTTLMASFLSGDRRGSLVTMGCLSCTATTMWQCRPCRMVARRGCMSSSQRARPRQAHAVEARSGQSIGQRRPQIGPRS